MPRYRQIRLQKAWLNTMDSDGAIEKNCRPSVNKGGTAIIRPLHVFRAEGVFYVYCFIFGQLPEQMSGKGQGGDKDA